MNLLQDYRARFAFLADAFNSTGGFRPRVLWTDETLISTDAKGNMITGVRRVPKVAGPSYLMQHARESLEKYAGRCSVAVYQPHLREACMRFVSFLSRRRPMRDGVDSPLAQLLLTNADLRGNSLDATLSTLALQLKARGTALVLLDMPRREAPPGSMREQIERRSVPFLRPILPESVCAYEVDDETGDLTSLSINCTEAVHGQERPCTRTWAATHWELRCDDKLVDRGEHGFPRCPVLAVTESGEVFPSVGRYAHVADLSLRLYNARSERDDILRGQTFSIFCLQVPEGASDAYSARDAVAAIGTHSMLVYQGEAPRFVSPDTGPTEAYRLAIEELERSIRHATLDESDTESARPESGLSRRLRFEQLNADLAGFSQRMQSLEQRIWALYHEALGVPNRVRTEWPTDFNLVDSQAELDILAAMQATGMPDAALNLKRKKIAAAEFDASDEADKAAVMAAIDEGEQLAAIGAAADDARADDPDGAGSTAEPAPPQVDLSPIVERLAAIEARMAEPAAAPVAPVINITVPEQPPAQVTVEAPHVTVNPPQITVEAPQITVEAPATAPPAPQPITLNTGGGGRVISLIKDATGQITGAAVNDA